MLADNVPEPTVTAYDFDVVRPVSVPLNVVVLAVGDAPAEGAGEGAVDEVGDGEGDGAGAVPLSRAVRAAAASTRP